MLFKVNVDLLTLKKLLVKEFEASNFSDAMLDALTLIVEEAGIDNIEDVHKAISDEQIIIFKEDAPLKSIIDEMLDNINILRKYGNCYCIIDMEYY